jgi:hypothetical protein
VLAKNNEACESFKFYFHHMASLELKNIMARSLQDAANAMTEIRELRKVKTDNVEAHKAATAQIKILRNDWTESMATYKAAFDLFFP